MVASPVTSRSPPDDSPIYLRVKRYLLASGSDLSRESRRSCIFVIRKESWEIARFVDSNAANIGYIAARHTQFASRRKSYGSGSRTGARNSAELVTLYEMKWTLNEKLHSSARKARPSRLTRGFIRAVGFKYNSNVAGAALSHTHASASPTARLVTAP